MLRVLVAALVFANIAFFVFAHGDFDGEREPERLKSQLHPETVRLLPMTAAAASAPPDVLTCWETPAFGAAEAGAIEATLANTLPAGSWVDVRGERAAGARVEPTHTYRVAAADGALAARLTLLRLDANGRGFGPCAKPR